MTDVSAPRWLLLFNPVSGRGQGLRDRPRIEAAAAAAGIVCDSVVSEYAGHCITLVADAIAAGRRHVLVAGGDGSLSEAVNGVFRHWDVDPRAVTLAQGPIGTGNDWARGNGVPRDYAGALRLAASGQTREFDVGTIDFAAGGRRHFINVAGIGFDAGVVENMPSRKLGRLAYLIGLIRELIAYRPLDLRYACGGDTHAAKAFLLFSCLGRYCGGGMHVAPNAVDDDGQLDLVLIRHLHLMQVLRALPKLFDGSIESHPAVTIRRHPAVELQAPAGAAIEADGELVGHAPARIDVMRRAIRIVVP